MRRTGIFFLMAAMFCQVVLIFHLLVIGLLTSASIVGIAILFEILACWYVDMGARREYSGVAVDACNLAPGKYPIKHYGLHATGAMSAVIVYKDSIRLCFVEGYYNPEISWEDIKVGKARFLQIAGSGLNKKYYICP